MYEKGKTDHRAQFNPKVAETFGECIMHSALTCSVCNRHRKCLATVFQLFPIFGKRLLVFGTSNKATEPKIGDN